MEFRVGSTPSHEGSSQQVGGTTMHKWNRGVSQHHSPEQIQQQKETTAHTQVVFAKNCPKETKEADLATRKGSFREFTSASLTSIKKSLATTFVKIALHFLGPKVKKESAHQELKSFFRGAMPPAYKKLNEMQQSSMKNCNLVETVRQKLEDNTEPKAILESIVVALEADNSSNTRAIGKALVGAFKEREGQEGSPVKDAVAFTASVFILRQGARIVADLPKEFQKPGMTALQNWQKAANDYSLGKTLEDPEMVDLLDRLAIALTGLQPHFN